MERKGYDVDGNFLTSPVVADILGVSRDFLTEIVEHKIVFPYREPMRHNLIVWGPEEVFRAHLISILIHEFEEKYGIDSIDYKYEQIRRDLLPTRRSRSREILGSDKWQAIVEKASKNGLNISLSS